MVLDILQWLGAGIAVTGYIYFLNDRKLTGASLTVVAGILLATWAAIMGAEGVLVLNLVILGVNAVSIGRAMWKSK